MQGVSQPAGEEAGGGDAQVTVMGWEGKGRGYVPPRSTVSGVSMGDFSQRSRTTPGSWVMFFLLYITLATEGKATGFECGVVALLGLGA